MPSSKKEDIVIGGVSISPGKRKRIGIEVAKLYDYTEMTIPVEVVRGEKDGPVLHVKRVEKCKPTLQITIPQMEGKQI